MLSVNLGFGLQFSSRLWNSDYQELFPEDLRRWLSELHHQFEPRRQELLAARKDRQAHYDAGNLPEYLDPNSEAARGNWKVAPIPPELQCRRVEITGPVNSAKMVINMLSPNEQGAMADMAMLDFEDSMKPSFPNVLDGYKNVIGAVSGNLSFHSGTKSYQLNPQKMAYVMIRTRGLHLDEANITVDGVSISAGMLDFAVCFYHTAKIYLQQKKTPKYYIPKCEHYLEARWWNDLFTIMEQKMGIPTGTMRATFLIETLPAVYQIEEILFEIRNHAAGLNVGRWDKIFSDIKVLKNHPDRIMPDRGTITMEKPWMENYAKRVIKICHARGAFAMGGMSAFTPGKTQQQRQEQTEKVLKDKQREAQWGHDGCWVSHPYFISYAMQAFQSKNQLQKQLSDFDKYPDILPRGEGPYTMQGLRTNIRVGIAYMHGWQQDIGCVAFDNLMEDLATLEISRAQVWQWVHHRVTLQDGGRVEPTLVSRIFDEEASRIIEEFGQDQRPQEAAALTASLRRASDCARELFLQPNLQDFLSLTSDKIS
jgi:malate synthase